MPPEPVSLAAYRNRSGALAELEPAGSSRKGQTVLALVAAMEAAGIRYVVMRNHEAYPAFGHDADFAIHPDDIPAWQTLLVRIAQDAGWDALSRCHHWDSEFAHQSPKSFLLYAKEPELDFLCVDLFHGATLWGQPLYSIEDVLGDSIHDPRGFDRMSEARETLLRILQVDALIGRKREATKVEGYIGRIRAWWPACGDATLALGSKLLGPTLRPAVNALFADDPARFKKLMRIARLWFLAKAALRNPYRAFRQATARSRGRLREVGGDQCGFVIAVPDATPEQRASMEMGLDAVTATNAIREWTDASGEEAGVTSRERAVMEQGSVAIKWLRSEAAFGTLTGGDLSSAVAAADNVFDLLIDRHEVLWRKKP